MSAHPPGQPAKSSDELAQERTDLALQRTIVAAERTLMAWIRTAISMIGFGFTIYKFLQYVVEAQKATHLLRHQYAPRNLGLTFLILGTLALVGAIAQHRQFLKRVGAAETRYMWSLAVVVAILVALIGIAAAVSILAGVGPF